MTRTRTLRLSLAGLVMAGAVALARTGQDGGKPLPAPQAANPGPNDHTMFGGSADRNMVNRKGKLPELPTKGPNWSDEKDVEGWLKEWTIWKADLGSKAYGGPLVAGGRVYVGTNNQRPRNPRDLKKSAEGDVEPVDMGVMMVFDEKSGKFLWQAVFDKLPSGRVHDWPEEGLCCTPTVEGDRVYFVTNRCTVVCADTEGFANGNQGVTGEKYQTPTDCDIVWEFDMMKELNVFPHNMSNCCPLIVGDIVYVITANGVDEGHLNIPQPGAPSFIALDKKSGKLLWKSNLPGRNIMHGQWSNPTYAEVNGVRQIIFPAGDGWLYSLAPETGELIWKFDGNPKDSFYVLGSEATRNDYIATPVVYDNKVYIGVGQDPEHTTGIGHFWCIDIPKALANAKKNPNKDVSPELVDKVVKGEDGKDKMIGKPNPDSAVAWHFGGEENNANRWRDWKFGRTMSTACIVDDVVYIGELTGILHCLNAKTGEQYWQYDTKSPMWGSAYYADGKILVTNDQGDLYVFKHDPKPKKIDELDIKPADAREATKLRQGKRKEVEQEYLLGRIEFDAPLRSTPVLANGVLYVMSEKTLFALKKGK